MKNDLEIPYSYLKDLGLVHFITYYQVTLLCEDLNDDKFLFYKGCSLDWFNIDLLENSVVELFNDEDNSPLDIKKDLLDILSGKIGLFVVIKKKIKEKEKK